MSKKLIAVASAAALALSALVVMPTVATATPGPFAVEATGAATNQTLRDGTTAAKSIQINVPSADVLEVNEADDVSGLTDSTAIELDIKVPTAGAAVTVTSTGGVKVVSETDWADADSSTGVQSLSVSADTAGDAKVYAYTTTTAGGTVVVSSAGSSTTFFVSGLSTSPYKMNFTLGASAPIGGKFTLTGTVKDALGNDLTTPLTAGQFEITILGGSAAIPKAAGTDAAFDFKYTAATKTYEFKGDVRDSAGSQAVVIEFANAADEVTAFGDPVNEQFFTVTGADLTAQVAALTAQVAALQATVAKRVTKKRYNTLARKWNRANPTAKVALKK